MPPRKFLNFRHSEIDSGAFWDAFPAWQGTRTNPGIAAAINLLHYARCTNDRLNFAQISKNFSFSILYISTSLFEILRKTWKRHVN